MEQRLQLGPESAKSQSLAGHKHTTIKYQKNTYTKHTKYAGTNRNMYTLRMRNKLQNYFAKYFVKTGRATVKTKVWRGEAGRKLQGAAAFYMIS